MAERAWSEEFRTSYVCVDSYESGILGGRFYNAYFPQGKVFRCLGAFLKAMDEILDQMDFPKAYTQKRTFLPNQSPPDIRETTQKNAGQKATFAIRVLFRQNASWQGSVTWLEGRQEQSFRSALELIFLINSVLDDKEVS